MLAAFYNSTLPRLIPVGMILIALQRTVFVEMQVFGVIVQVVLAFAATAGAVAGPDRGAIAGFVLGIMFDLSTGSPLGSSAITMGGAAAIAGWLEIVRIESTWYLVALFVGIASGIGELGVPTVRFLIGERDAFVPETWTIVPIVAVTAAILSIPCAPLARWTVRADRADWRPDRVKGQVADEQ